MRTAGLSCLFKQASISRNDLHRCKRYIKGTPSGDIRFNIQQTPRSTIRIPSRFLASATATKGLAMRYILFLLGFESAVVSCTAFPSLRLGARRLSLHHGNPTWRDMSESFAFSSSTSDDTVLTHTAGRSAPSGLRLLWLSILHVDSDRWLVLGQRFRPRLRTPSSGSLLTWKSRIGWTSPCCASKVHGSRQFATIRSASNDSTMGSIEIVQSHDPSSKFHFVTFNGLKTDSNTNKRPESQRYSTAARKHVMRG